MIKVLDANPEFVSLPARFGRPGATVLARKGSPVRYSNATQARTKVDQLREAGYAVRLYVSRVFYVRLITEAW